VRVHLDIENARLRRALTDLLEDAGHVVDTSPRSEAVGLRIVSAPGAGGAGHKVPTLYLRPGRGFPAAKDPGDALQAALRSGGAATWSPPLDAELLVACLGEAASGTRAASALQAAPPLHSPEPWFVIDPRTMEVWWASEAARVRFLVPGRSRLSERGAAAVPSTALHTENGGEVRTVEGRPHFVLWWTDDHGRRVVGLLHLPAGSSTTPGDANVSTLAELGRVSATLAHEIRNPLASFAGALDLLGRAGDPDERATARGLGDASDVGEPEPRPALLRRPEGREDLLADGGGDARPVVLDADQAATLPRLDPHRDASPPALRLRGVDEEVHHRLAERVGMRDDVLRRGARLDAQLDLVEERVGAHGGDHRAHDVGRRDGLGRAAEGAREPQRVVEHRAHAVEPRARETQDRRALVGVARAAEEVEGAGE